MFRPILEELSFSGEIKSATYDIVGGIYANFYENDTAELPASVSTAFQLSYVNETGGNSSDPIFPQSFDKIISQEIQSTNSTLPLIETYDFFKSASFNFSYAGYAAFQPVKNGNSTNFSNPDYYGRHRLALDGLRFKLNLNAEVESKYLKRVSDVKTYTI